MIHDGNRTRVSVPPALPHLRRQSHDAADEGLVIGRLHRLRAVDVRSVIGKIKRNERLKSWIARDALAKARERLRGVVADSIARQIERCEIGEVPNPEREILERPGQLVKGTACDGGSRRSDHQFRRPSSLICVNVLHVNA